MRIGILQTGKVMATLVPRYGEYPGMFEAMLRPAIPGLETETFAVVDGVLPDRPDQCDAWLITGSKHGVYDPLPWIEPLKEFLRAARGTATPIVGICFGHQILAEAFGGRAEKSDRGWGCGVHRYDVVRRPSWMTGGPDRPAWHAMHQDQVTAVPRDAAVLASSEFCPFAMLAYGDAERPDAISIQPHPEFETDYARDLVVLRSGAVIPPEASEPAMRSFGEPVHTDLFARWVAAYLARTGACAATG